MKKAILWSFLVLFILSLSRSASPESIINAAGRALTTAPTPKPTVKPARVAQGPSPAPTTDLENREEATPTPAPTKKPEKDQRDAASGKTRDEEPSWFGWLLEGFFALLPLALPILLTLGCAWWLRDQILALEQKMNSQKREAALQRQQFELDLKNLGQDLDKSLDSMWQEFRDQHSRDANSQQQVYSNLENRIERLREGMEPAKSRGMAPEPMAFRQRETPAVSRPRTPAFTSAMEYINRAGNYAVRAKTMNFRPEYLQRAEGDDLYLLIPEEGQRNLYKVIPGVPRFSSSQDYSHFLHFYDCDQPSSGEVLIVEPALAVYETEADRWRLERKGRLQIS
ncbi:MAG: hypothetical protein ACREEM_31635 [Blastocatellia bacterium]